MASSPAELSLDCKPHSDSMLLKSFGDESDQRYKLEEFLSHLEEERLKIDAFKRELPLCMQLLTNGVGCVFALYLAVEASRQQLHAFRTNHQGTRPVLEDFIPIKQSNFQENIDKASNMSDNKANWMTSAQLWSQTSEGTKPQSTITTSKDSSDIGFMSISPKLAIHNKHRNGGAFLPFSKERNSYHLGSSASRALPELALDSAQKDLEEKKCEEAETRVTGSGKGGNDGRVIDEGKGAEVASEAQTTSGTTTTSQTNRKARRCWSPDLHRRFVNALQMLGGSQVATPKQIRELMKVDGLTNEEVKSHLQKYRLHTRRPCPSLQTGAPAPQLVVLGGIWVPQEYASAAASAHTGATALYGQHPTSYAPPPHYLATTPVPQEFYTVAPSQSPLPPPPHHHAFHHLQMYNTVQNTRSSVESELAGGGNRSESIEDGKSESGSWKGEIGEKGGERKREESTGSEITLKF